MSFKMQNEILVPVLLEAARTATRAEAAICEKLCVLCQRPVDGPEYFNANWPWPTCGHGRFPRHQACMTALDHAFPLQSCAPPSEWRSAAFDLVSCPICGCGCEYT